MTEFEQKCYGMTEEDIREEYINGITGRLSGIEMVVASILSDCQEMLEMGHDKDAVRGQLNSAINCLFESKKETV